MLRNLKDLEVLEGQAVPNTKQLFGHGCVCKASSAWRLRFLVQSPESDRGHASRLMQRCLYAMDFGHWSQVSGSASGRGPRKKGTKGALLEADSRSSGIPLGLNSLWFGAPCSVKPWESLKSQLTCHKDVRGAFFSLFNMTLGLACYLWGARVGACLSRLFSGGTPHGVCGGSKACCLQVALCG